MTIKEKITQLLAELAGGESFSVEIPPQKDGFGDYTSNLPLRLATKKKESPLKIGQEIIQKLPETDFLAQKTVVPPGFLHFFLKKEWLVEALGEILKQGEDYGKSRSGKGQSILIEFLSANPTGPLTLGNGRGGFLGDFLAQLFEFLGFKVTREYYVNDMGTQIENLGRSVLGEKGEGLYQGEYIEALKQKIKSQSPKEAGQKAAQLILTQLIQKTVKKAKIQFDSWVLESEIIRSGLVEKVIAELKQKNLVYRKDGALWFCASRFQDDKDRVLVKQNGEYTYFLTDIAYHLNKLQRGYHRLINIWGADHHGDVNRMLAAAEVFGFKERLTLILHQFVSLTQEGEQVKMSKRAGRYLTLDQLIDEVGLDAVRFFYLSKSTDTHLDFDLEKAKAQSLQNPVYYIQYVSARCHSLLEKAKGVLPVKPDIPSHPAEIRLLKKLIHFPDLLQEIALHFQAYRLPNYLLELADSFHRFYEECPVLEEKNAGRLALVLATRMVLENGLRLMKIEAPKRM